MPRVAKRQKRYRTLGEGHYLQFASGFDYLGDGFGNGEALDVDGLREAWADCRETVLAEWIAEHPGTRPWAWWICDAPSPRLRYDGVLVPCDELGAHWAANGVPKHGHGDDFYEPQRAYLARHGLLVESEV